MRFLLLLVLAALLVGCSPSSQFKQQEYYTVVGRINDEYGRAIPGAKVIVRLEIGDMVEQRVDEQGRFSLTVHGPVELRAVCGTVQFFPPKYSIVGPTDTFFPFGAQVMSDVSQCIP